MSRHTSLTVAISLLASLILVDTAAAYYSPSMGRFLNRDPIVEPGAVLVRQAARPATAFIPRDPVNGDTTELLREGILADPKSEPTRPWRALHPFTFAENNPISQVDLLGLCTCKAEVKASFGSSGLPGLHLYVQWEKSGCASGNESGSVHWKTCGFIGMCPSGSASDGSSRGKGWGDDGTSANGSPGPTIRSDCDGCDMCACLKDIMDTKFKHYFFLGPNSNSAALWAAEQCGVNTSGITGYPGQGNRNLPIESGGLQGNHGCK